MALTKALGGGGGGSALTVKDEGSTLSTAVTSIDVVGDGATATGTTAVTLTIPSTRKLIATNATGSFSSIPATYTHLAIVLLAQGTAAATSVGARLQFNADTAGNYDWDRENRFGSAQGVASTYIEIAEVTGSTAPANTATLVSILIPHYTGTAWHKIAEAPSSFMKTSAAGGGLILQRCAGIWRSTAAITSLTISPSSSAWHASSVFTLYGLP